MKTKTKTVQIPETDAERLDWLQADHRRLQDCYYHVENEGSTVREAIDKLADLQAE